MQIGFRTCDRALRLLNEVWADILGNLDNDLIAYAKEVKADTLVALVDEVIKERQTAGEEGDEALHEAAILLHQAADERVILGSPAKQIEDLMKCAKLYHRLQDVASRDKVAHECREVSTQWQTTKKHIHQDQILRFSSIQRICVYASAIIASA